MNWTLVLILIFNGQITMETERGFNLSATCSLTGRQWVKNMESDEFKAIYKCFETVGE